MSVATLSVYTIPAVILIGSRSVKVVFHRPHTTGSSRPRHCRGKISGYCLRKPVAAQLRVSPAAQLRVSPTRVT